MEHNDIKGSIKVAEPMVISGLEPYTLDELYARIQQSEDEIRRGKVKTEQQVREELKSEFLWLQ